MNSIDRMALIKEIDAQLEHLTDPVEIAKLKKLRQKLLN